MNGKSHVVCEMKIWRLGYEIQNISISIDFHLHG